MLRRTFLLATLCAAFAAPALAQSDQERARSAFQSGEARSLDEILGQVRRAYPGRVLDAELRGGRYNIKILDSGGRVVELEADAKSGRVLGVREGGRRGGRGKARDRDDDRGAERDRGRGKAWDRDDDREGRGRGRGRGPRR